MDSIQIEERRAHCLARIAECQKEMAELDVLCLQMKKTSITAPTTAPAAPAAPKNETTAPAATKRRHPSYKLALKKLFASMEDKKMMALLAEFQTDFYTAYDKYDADGRMAFAEFLETKELVEDKDAAIKVMETIGGSKK